MAKRKGMISSEWHGDGFILQQADHIFELAIRLHLCDLIQSLHRKMPIREKNLKEKYNLVSFFSENTAAWYLDVYFKEIVGGPNTKLDSLAERFRVLGLGSAIFFGNIKSIPPVDPNDDLDKILESIGFGTVAELKEIIMSHTKSEINKRDSLKKIGLCCIALSTLYNYIYFKTNIKNRDAFVRELVIAGKHIIGKSHEAIGYWTAKLEERKRNRESVNIRTEKKNDHIEFVRKILTLEIQNNKEKLKLFRQKVQKDLGVTEMTVRNYLKEINKERKLIKKR